MSDGILISFHEGFDVPFAEPAIEIHGELATATCVGHTAQHGAGRLWLTRDHGRSPQHIDVGPLTDPYAE